MDHYQSIVVDYLRADRAVFVNTECCIQLNKGDNPDTSGPHWYCDALAVNLREPKVLLCEITYAKEMTALFKRLKAWSEHWDALKAALVRDCRIDPTWTVVPWVFAPAEMLQKHDSALRALKFEGNECRVTSLEDVQPWKYCSWDRIRESAGAQKAKQQEH